MSRARKLCEEINAFVREYGCAYITYNCMDGISVIPDVSLNDVIVMRIRAEITEETLLDAILMRWENESDSSAHYFMSNYLWAIRDRLWSDYNVD